MTEHNSNTLIFQGSEVKALDESGKIGGYLVVFSGEKDPDLSGDFFTSETDFGPIKSTSILFDHGMDETILNRVIGSGEWKVDEIGVWVEGILDRRDRYEEAIFKLAQQGKLGWSSGTASHLVQRERKGESYWIKSWPLGIDASLTPTPAEPRTKAIELKAGSFKNLLAAIDAAQPQKAEPKAGESAASVAATGAQPDDNATKNSTLAMENEVKEQEVKEAPAPGHAEVKSAEKQALGTITLTKEQYDELHAKAVQPRKEAVKSAPDMSNLAPNLNLKTERGDDEMKAYAHFLRTGDAVKADVDMQVGTDAEGGYLAPALHYETIIERRDEMSIPRAAGAMVFTGSHKSIEVPVQASDAAATTLTAEEAAETRDSPVIGQVVLTAYKYTQSITLSNELVQDHKSNLLQVIANYVSQGMALRENSNFLVGTGSSQPQGIYVGGTAAFTAANAAALTPAEVVNLMYDLPGEYADNAAWFMHRGTEGYIRGLTGDMFQFDVNPGGTGNTGQNGGSLLGAPVFTSSANATLATGNKSVCVGNPQYYGLYDRMQLEVLRDPYSKAANGQVVFHYSWRQGGAVLQAEAFQYITQA